MSTITKEQLRERAREKVNGLEYALKHPGAFADTLIELEEELELARIALASLEAEIHSYTFEDDPRPLYTAPPAPVVPDLCAAIEALLDMQVRMVKQTNLGASFYDSETISAMNYVPIQAKQALELAKPYK